MWSQPRSRRFLNAIDLYYRTGDTIEESIDKILLEKAEESARDLEDVLSKMGTPMRMRR
jgi:hypothetical protein